MVAFGTGIAESCHSLGLRRPDSPRQPEHPSVRLVAQGCSLEPPTGFRSSPKLGPRRPVLGPFRVDRSDVFGDPSEVLG